MSIYATRWILKFPSQGDEFPGCDWVELIGQGVPAHIGTPSPGYGSELGDPFASFLPPAIPVPENDDGMTLRAMVVVHRGAEKVGQEYVRPLLVLSGSEYSRMTFENLYERICDALRENLPRCVVQILEPNGRIRVVFEDGSTREVQSCRDEDETDDL
jgi:hypothetical protein